MACDGGLLGTLTGLTKSTDHPSAGASGITTCLRSHIDNMAEVPAPWNAQTPLFCTFLQDSIWGYGRACNKEDFGLTIYIYIQICFQSDIGS